MYYALDDINLNIDEPIRKGCVNCDHCMVMYENEEYGLCRLKLEELLEEKMRQHGVFKSEWQLAMWAIQFAIENFENITEQPGCKNWREL